MAGEVQIRGVKTVMANMEASLNNMGLGTTKGMAEAALFAVSQAQKDVPVMTGQLRRGGFVDPPRESWMMGRHYEVVFGFKGPYAVKVHENIRSGRTQGVSPKGRRYRQWARKGKAFFFFRALRSGQRRMLAIIVRSSSDFLIKYTRVKGTR